MSERTYTAAVRNSGFRTRSELMVPEYAAAPASPSSDENCAVCVFSIGMAALVSATTRRNEPSIATADVCDRPDREPLRLSRPDRYAWPTSEPRFISWLMPNSAATPATPRPRKPPARPIVAAPTGASSGTSSATAVAIAPMRVTLVLLASFAFTVAAASRSAAAAFA